MNSLLVVGLLSLASPLAAVKCHVGQWSRGQSVGNLTEREETNGACLYHIEASRSGSVCRLTTSSTTAPGGCSVREESGSSNVAELRCSCFEHDFCSTNVTFLNLQKMLDELRPSLIHCWDSFFVEWIKYTATVTTTATAQGDPGTASTTEETTSRTGRASTEAVTVETETETETTRKRTNANIEVETTTESSQAHAEAETTRESSSIPTETGTTSESSRSIHASLGLRAWINGTVTLFGKLIGLH